MPKIPSILQKYLKRPNSCTLDKYNHFNSLGAAALLLSGLFLSGCLPAATRDDLARDWQKGWQNWAEMGQSMSDYVHGDNPDTDIRGRGPCIEQGPENRQESENGDSDWVGYQTCADAPYPTRSLGERLSPGHVNPVELNRPLGE